VVSLIVAALLGAPIFVVLGGTALLLFLADGVPVAALPVETYRMLTSPSLPTVPLFTLTGCILAEGDTSQRLVAFFVPSSDSCLAGWRLWRHGLCLLHDLYRRLWGDHSGPRRHPLAGTPA
jgi:hypothetical protein